MRYQVIEVIQLVFALSLILGAFVGGLAAGWWRWGRNAGDEAVRHGARPPGPGALFSPEDREDEIVLSEIHDRPMASPTGAVFGTGHPDPARGSASVVAGLTGPAGAIGPPADGIATSGLLDP